MSCLLEDTALGTWRKIITGFARNCDKTRFYRVFILAVTAASPVEIPAVSLNELNEIANFHGLRGCRASLETSMHANNDRYIELIYRSSREPPVELVRAVEDARRTRQIIGPKRVLAREGPSCAHGCSFE